MLIVLILQTLLAQSPDAQCHLKCGEVMDRCLKACQAGGKSEKQREKAMACLKTCGDQQEPCLDACDQATNKKK